MKMYFQTRTLQVFIVIMLANLISTEELQTDQTYYGQTPAFTPEERYLDIFPLTRDNFTRSVMRNKDAWVVVFHEGSMIRGWKAMAVSLRGVVWMGMVNIKTEAKLLKELGYTPGKDPVARIYPYGNKKTKQDKWKALKTPNEARQIVVDSLPNKVLKMKGSDIQSFLIDSFTSRPSRFPIILLTDELDTPAYFKGLANRFEKYFNFGCIIQPTFQDYQSLGLQNEFIEPPHILVLVPSKLGMQLSDKLEFSAVPYTERNMGKIDYPNVMQFLFAVNSQYRHWLPGDNQSNSQKESEMSDIVEIEELRFDILVNGKKKGPNHSANSIEDMSIKAASIEHATRDEL